MLIGFSTSAYRRGAVFVLMAGLAVENFIRKPFHIIILVTLLKDSALARASSMHSHRDPPHRPPRFPEMSAPDGCGKDR